ncbi:MAG: EF-hand domain-containing protein [Pseudomonadota bacterium]
MSIKPNSGPGRSSLSTDDLADFGEQFDECDVDGDQRIDFAEFSRLLDRMGSEVEMARRRGQFDRIDKDHDGLVDRSEFVEWLRGM